jgi:acetolactate decarboxylase
MFKSVPAFLFLVAVHYILSCSPAEDAEMGKEITIIGQMKDVMWKGELAGLIDLDTLNRKVHLYGMGPEEFLRGEILVVDGKSYKSNVLTNSTMLVEETFEVKAPFFAYTQISEWGERLLPDSIQSLKQVEGYLDQVTKSSKRPFFFKILGMVDEATIHIVNLPKGSKVSSPDEAHQGQVDYKLKNVSSELIGFFSTEHKAIFTHHDTYLHIHLITQDRQKMGHLDQLVLGKGAKLFLPKD